MNCDNCEDPKNSRIAAMGRVSRSPGREAWPSTFPGRNDIFSLIARSMRTRRCELVLEQLAHRADAAVAEVIDVVDDERRTRLADVLTQPQQV